MDLFIFQVTTLVSSKSPINKKGKSKRAIVLVAAVERATENFVERGEVRAAIFDKMLRKKGVKSRKCLKRSSYMETIRIW